MGIDADREDPVATPVECPVPCISTALETPYDPGVISCRVADELSAKHIHSLEQVSANDSSTVAMARKADADLAWEAVCGHRATCWRCAAHADFVLLQGSSATMQ